MQEQVATGGGAARHRPRRSACGRIGCGEMRPPIWRSPNFLKLWSAGTVSDLGSEITELALLLTAILILHAPPSQIGVLGAVRAVPYLLLGVSAGVLAYRSLPVTF